MFNNIISWRNKNDKERKIERAERLIKEVRYKQKKRTKKFDLNSRVSKQASQPLFFFKHNEANLKTHLSKTLRKCKRGNFSRALKLCPTILCESAPDI